MAQLAKSAASLRITGDDLVPEEITKLLGGSPTLAYAKGDKKVGHKTGKVWIRKGGMWSLSAANRKPEDLDGQIDEILSQLSSDLSIWAEIGKRFKIDLFCGFFMKECDEGLTLSARSMAALGVRGIEAGFCLYGPDEKPAEPEESQN
jgi:hypothetical protein